MSKRKRDEGIDLSIYLNTAPLEEALTALPAQLDQRLIRIQNQIKNISIKAKVDILESGDASKALAIEQKALKQIIPLLQQVKSLTKENYKISEQIPDFLDPERVSRAGKAYINANKALKETESTLEKLSTISPLSKIADKFKAAFEINFSDSLAKEVEKSVKSLGKLDGASNLIEKKLNAIGQQSEIRVRAIVDTTGIETAEKTRISKKETEQVTHYIQDLKFTAIDASKDVEKLNGEIAALTNRGQTLAEALRALKTYQPQTLFETIDGAITTPYSEVLGKGVINKIARYANLKGKLEDLIPQVESRLAENLTEYVKMAFGFSEVAPPDTKTIQSLKEKITNLNAKREQEKENSTAEIAGLNQQLNELVSQQFNLLSGNNATPDTKTIQSLKEKIANLNAKREQEKENSTAKMAGYSQQRENLLSEITNIMVRSGGEPDARDSKTIQKLSEQARALTAKIEQEQKKSQAKIETYNQQIDKATADLNSAVDKNIDATLRAPLTNTAREQKKLEGLKSKLSDYNGLLNSAIDDAFNKLAEEHQKNLGLIAEKREEVAKKLLEIGTSQKSASDLEGMLKQLRRLEQLEAREMKNFLAVEAQRDNSRRALNENFERLKETYATAGLDALNYRASNISEMSYREVEGTLGAINKAIERKIEERNELLEQANSKKRLSDFVQNYAKYSREELEQQYAALAKTVALASEKSTRGGVIDPELASAIRQLERLKIVLSSPTPNELATQIETLTTKANNATDSIQTLKDAAKTFGVAEKEKFADYYLKEIREYEKAIDTLKKSIRVSERELRKVSELMSKTPEGGISWGFQLEKLRAVSTELETQNRSLDETEKKLANLKKAYEPSTGRAFFEDWNVFKNTSSAVAENINNLASTIPRAITALQLPAETMERLKNVFNFSNVRDMSTFKKAAEELKKTGKNIQSEIRTINAELKQTPFLPDEQVEKLKARLAELKSNYADFVASTKATTQKISSLESVTPFAGLKNGLIEIKNYTTQTYPQLIRDAKGFWGTWAAAFDPITRPLSKLKAQLDSTSGAWTSFAAKFSQPLKFTIPQSFTEFSHSIKRTFFDQFTNYNPYMGVTDAAGSFTTAIPKAIELFTSGIDDLTNISKLGKIGTMVGTFSLLAKTVTSVATAVKGLENSLMNAARPALDAQNALYIMSLGMHSTVDDMMKLSVLAQVSGVQMNSIQVALRRVNTLLVRTGESSGLARETLKKFGAEMRDTNGNLKQGLAQIDEIARAYARAQALGQGAEFRYAIGGRYWDNDFVALIADYQSNLEAMKSIKTTGLADPTLAYSVRGAMYQMEAQEKQFVSAFSSIFMPVVEQLAVELKNRYAHWVQVIENHSESIKAVGFALGDFVANISKAGTALLELAVKAGDAVASFDYSAVATEKFIKSDAGQQSLNRIETLLLNNDAVLKDLLLASKTDEGLSENALGKIIQKVYQDPEAYGEGYADELAAAIKQGSQLYVEKFLSEKDLEKYNHLLSVAELYKNGGFAGNVPEKITEEIAQFERRFADALARDLPKLTSELIKIDAKAEQELVENLNNAQKAYEGTLELAEQYKKEVEEINLKLQYGADSYGLKLAKIEKEHNNRIGDYTDFNYSESQTKAETDYFEKLEEHLQKLVPYEGKATAEAVKRDKALRESANTAIKKLEAEIEKLNEEKEARIKSTEGLKNADDEVKKITDDIAKRRKAYVIEYLTDIGMLSGKEQLENEKLINSTTQYLQKLQENRAAQHQANEQTREAIELEEQLTAAKQRELEEEMSGELRKYSAETAKRAYEATHTAFEMQIRDIQSVMQAQMQSTKYFVNLEKQKQAQIEITANAATRRSQAVNQEMKRMRGEVESLEEMIYRQEHSQYENDILDAQKQAKELLKKGNPNDKAYAARVQHWLDNQLADIEKRAKQSGREYTSRPLRGKENNNGIYYGNEDGGGKIFGTAYGSRNGGGASGTTPQKTSAYMDKEDFLRFQANNTEGTVRRLEDYTYYLKNILDEVDSKSFDGDYSEFQQAMITALQTAIGSDYNHDYKTLNSFMHPMHPAESKDFYEQRLKTEPNLESNATTEIMDKYINYLKNTLDQKVKFTSQNTPNAFGDEMRYYETSRRADIANLQKALSGLNLEYSSFKDRESGATAEEKDNYIKNLEDKLKSQGESATRLGIEPPKYELFEKTLEALENDDNFEGDEKDRTIKALQTVLDEFHERITKIQEANYNQPANSPSGSTGTPSESGGYQIIVPDEYKPPKITDLDPFEELQEQVDKTMEDVAKSIDSTADAVDNFGEALQQAGVDVENFSKNLNEVFPQLYGQPQNQQEIQGSNNSTNADIAGKVASTATASGAILGALEQLVARGLITGALGTALGGPAVGLAALGFTAGGELLDALKDKFNNNNSVPQQTPQLPQPQGVSPQQAQSQVPGIKASAELQDITNKFSDFANALWAKLDAITQRIGDLASAIQGGKQQEPNVTVNVGGIDLGGAYVFDNEMKTRLTSDITTEIANAVKSAVQRAATQNQPQTSF